MLKDKRDMIHKHIFAVELHLVSSLTCNGSKILSVFYIIVMVLSSHFTSHDHIWKCFENLGCTSQFHKNYKDWTVPILIFYQIFLCFMTSFNQRNLLSRSSTSIVIKEPMFHKHHLAKQCKKEGLTHCTLTLDLWNNVFL